MKLETSTALFNELHKTADKRGLKKTISKAHLMSLLIDHSRMVAALEAIGKMVEVKSR